MATSFKVLGQSAPTVPVSSPLPVLVPDQGAGVVVSSITVANKNANSTDYFYIKAAVGGTSTSASTYDKQFVAYRMAIAPNATITLTLGITLASGDTIIAYSEGGNCLFNAFGTVNS